MGYLSEKVAYLKGLSDGMEIKNDSKEGKLISAIIETLEEMAAEVEDTILMQEEMQEQLDEVDEALADLEEDFYEFDEDEFDDDDDFDEDEILEQWDDEEEYSFECPKCGDMVYFDISLLEDGEENLICPNCKEPIVLEFDCDNEDE